MDMSQYQCRHFVSYSGVKLPLKLVNPLDDDNKQNRNTFFRGYFDSKNQLLVCQNVVYGEIELQHRYSYYDNGQLESAEITDADGEVTVLRFELTTDSAK